mmetsp:Transcript_484/g.1124  ORF Transcript_484/g.1124 Transcript_484/m.1124 type:complete len:300 (+) Transcript_484:1456-2355(+)
MSVVRHDHHHALFPGLTRGQFSCQPHDGQNTQVIGRFVQEQQIGLGKNSRGQHRTDAPSTRQLRQGPGPQFRGEAQVLEERRSPSVGGIAPDLFQLRQDLSVTLGALRVETLRRDQRLERGQLLQQQGPLDIRLHHTLDGRLPTLFRRQVDLLRHVVHRHIFRDVADASCREGAQHGTLAHAVPSDQTVATAPLEGARRIFQQWRTPAGVGQREFGRIESALVRPQPSPRLDGGNARVVQLLFDFHGLKGGQFHGCHFRLLFTTGLLPGLLLGQTFGLFIDRRLRFAAATRFVVRTVSG